MAIPSFSSRSTSPGSTSLRSTPAPAARLFGAAAALLRHRGGAAGLEFAMIVPLLLGLGFMSAEVGQGVEVSRKLGRATATVGLVAAQQNASVTRSDLAGIMGVGDAALQPYNRSSAIFSITGVKITNDTTPKAVVMWSLSYTNGTVGAGRAKNSEVTIPKDMMKAGDFFIMTESTLSYKPMIAWTTTNTKLTGMTSAFASIEMSDTRFHTPRYATSEIVCSDCP